jgi:hypothetical protein
MALLSQIKSLMLLRYLTSSRVQPLEVRSKLVFIFFLNREASLEKAGCVYESAVGDPTGAELALVAPTRARLEVVVAEVGLVEAALVGLTAVKVKLAAAEASLQLALHQV